MAVVLGVIAVCCVCWAVFWGRAGEDPHAGSVDATIAEDFQDEMRVTVIATGFEMKPETNAFAPKAAAGARPSTPSFVPEDIDTPVAASRQPTKPADMGDIDEIFSIFKR